MKTASVVTVVLNWNSVGEVIECIRAIKAGTYPDNRIVVVDNASEEAPDKILEAFPDVMLIKNRHNMGWGGGVNKGIRFAWAQGVQYTWLVNTDVVVRPEALTELVQAAEAEPETGILSPVLYFHSTPDRVQNCGSTVDYKNFTLNDLVSLNDITADNENSLLLWGTGLLVRNSILAKTGLFNEKYFIYGEDMEFSLRVLEAGYRTGVVRSAGILHKSHDYDVLGRKGLPLYFFFYSRRNRLWFWMAHLKGLQRVRFGWRYFREIFHEIGHHKREDNRDRCYAAIDGFFCGIFNLAGEWKNKRMVPEFICRVLMSHPFFFADALEGKFFKITRSFLGGGRSLDA